jgi:hypothetical protein
MRVLVLAVMPTVRPPTLLQTLVLVVAVEQVRVMLVITRIARAVMVAPV